VVEGLVITAITVRQQRSQRRAELSRLSAKRYEAAAHHSEERFRLLVENVKDYAIYMLDPEGKVISWNSGAERINGYKEGEILGRHFSCFFPPEAADTVPKRLLEEAARQGNVEDEGWRVRKDGSRYLALSVLTALTDGQGNLKGFSKITRDITERRKAEDKFRGLMESAPDAHIIVNEKGQIVLVNSQAEKLFGYSREEMIGRPIELLIPTEQRDGHVKLRDGFIAQPVARPMGAGVDLHALRRDGSLVPVEISLAPVKTPDGILVAAAIRDTTERKRISLELQHAKDEAEAANRAKDQFLAVLSHELRTPLTPALMVAAALEASPELTIEAREDVEIIRRNIDLEAKLIDDLLDLTRIAHGKMALNLDTVNVHWLLRTTAEICRGDIEGKQLLLRQDLSARDCTLRADPARLQQVFWNLLKNAVKFTPAGGSITIRTRNIRGRADGDPDGDTQLAIEFSDTGIGIAPESLPRIFEVFEQTSPTITRAFGGLGLGLAISKNLIDLHHGSISVSSPGRNQGTTFTVVLPLVSAAVGKDELETVGAGR